MAPGYWRTENSRMLAPCLESHLTDVDHLEFGKPCEEFTKRLVSALVINVVLFAGVLHQVVERLYGAAIDLLPERRCRGVQLVVVQSVEVEQHGSAVGQRREDGL